MKFQNCKLKLYKTVVKQNIYNEDIQGNILKLKVTENYEEIKQIMK